MTAIRQTVMELNESFQLSPLPVFDGHIAFWIEDMGRLDLEEHREELLIRLARTIPETDDRLAVQSAALEAVHYKHAAPLSIQASMNNNTLIFSARLNAHDANVPAIDRIIHVLNSLHEKVLT